MHYASYGVTSERCRSEPIAVATYRRNGIG